MPVSPDCLQTACPAISNYIVVVPGPEHIAGQTKRDSDGNPSTDTSTSSNKDNGCIMGIQKISTPLVICQLNVN